MFISPSFHVFSNHLLLSSQHLFACLLPNLYFEPLNSFLSMLHNFLPFSFPGTRILDEGLQDAQERLSLTSLNGQVVGYYPTVITAESLQTSDTKCSIFQENLHEEL